MKPYVNPFDALLAGGDPVAAADAANLADPPNERIVFVRDADGVLRLTWVRGEEEQTQTNLLSAA
jgi:hypothetical protein